MKLDGMVLLLVASALGVRVTSALRTPAENEAAGGSPTSLHLEGRAIDVAADTVEWKVNILKAFSARSGFHTKGTREHWHFEAGPITLAAASVPVLALAALRQSEEK